jgi:hypothetical protein
MKAKRAKLTQRLSETRKPAQKPTVSRSTKARSTSSAVEKGMRRCILENASTAT